MVLMIDSNARQIQLENMLAKYNPRMMTDEDFDSMRKAIDELKSIFVERDDRASAAKTKPVTIVTGRLQKP
jgi:hypothetical protein